MAEKKSERIRMWVVLGLSLLLMGSIYLRFIHAKVGRVENQTVPADPAPPKVPSIDIKNTLNPRKGPLNPGFLESKISDLFKPFASAIPEAGALGPGASPPVGEAPRQETPQAGSSFHLKGTIVGGRKPIAIIDGSFVRPGDRLGEYKVVRIGKTDVLLASGDQRLTLEILKNE